LFDYFAKLFGNTFITDALEARKKDSHLAFINVRISKWTIFQPKVATYGMIEAY